MVSYAVIVVEPKTGGNIGAIARSMANFGLKELILVNPREIGEEAYIRAMHAQDILDEAKVVNSFEEAAEMVDLLVATSARTVHSEKKTIRVPMTPEEFFSKFKDYGGKIGIVFGREDYGLYNDELMKCDLFISIPANPEYPVLNLSHAATVIFYELYRQGYEPTERTEASGHEKEKLFQFFDGLLDAIKWPEYKKNRASITFRRLISRAAPTKWEFYTIAGVIKRAKEIIEQGMEEK
jgi:tRNA/rRNA methyltransferase